MAPPFAVILVFGIFALFVLMYATAVPAFWDGSLSDRLRRRMARILLFSWAVSAFLAVFAFVYWALSQQSTMSFTPGSLNKMAAAYFTVGVFATTGFGEIHPRNGFAQFVTTTQMVADVLLLAAVFAVAVNRALSPSGHWRLGLRGRRIAAPTGDESARPTPE